MSEIRNPSNNSSLQLGPRRRPKATDPLVGHGRHFGRTVYALCTVHNLILRGLDIEGEFPSDGEHPLPLELRAEWDIYQALLKISPGLHARLMVASAEDTEHISELLQRGVQNARSDDTKTLKGAILEWITPRGVPLNPPLARNIKSDRGFHHPTTGYLLCPVGVDWEDEEVKAKLKTGEISVAGDQWPLFLYQDYIYNPSDPWNGLLRSKLLVNAYKHIFTSPSSVDKEPKAVRGGNARIHGMTSVTEASIAYLATQVRFALSSAAVFSRTDTITDSERFYNTVLNLLQDVEEQQEVHDLLAWWNRQIFPAFITHRRPASQSSALAKIKERRAMLLAAAGGGASAASSQ